MNKLIELTNEELLKERGKLAFKYVEIGAFTEFEQGIKKIDKEIDRRIEEGTWDYQ